MIESKLVMVKSVSQAVKLKNEDSAFLAGGTEVNRLGSSVKAKTLIGINRLLFNQIENAKVEGKDGKKHDFVKIGALATFQNVVESSVVPEYLRIACNYMSSRTRRNMATVGGNVSLLRDDSYISPVLLSSGAKIEFSTGRIVDFNDYLNNRKKFDNSLITSVYVRPNGYTVSKRYSNTAASHAVITMAVSWYRSGGFSIALALKNAGLFKLSQLEELVNANLRSKEREFLSYFKEEWKCRITDDIFGSEDYKRYLLGVTCFDLVNEILRMREKESAK